MAEIEAGTSPWTAQQWRKNGSTWNLVTTTPTFNSTYNAVSFTGNGLIYVSDDEILKDFKNYTVNFTGGGSQIGSWRIFGVAARIGLDAETKLITETSPIVTVGTEANSGAGKVYFRTTRYSFATDAIDYSFVMAPNSMYDFSFKFDDDDIIMSVAEENGTLEQVYQLSSDTITPAIPETPGTVGVYAEDMTGYVKDFSVALNTTDIPAATAVDSLFTVDAANPVIAMSELTKVMRTVIFMPALTNGILYFSTVNAAAALDNDVTLNFKACGMGDYTSPPVGLVASYNAATCKKSIDLRQYREHGTTRTANHFDMRRVAEP
ncbi:MAG: hypothetical protein U0K54_02635 [Acutalibacteraceae bacterium]|nr:hypothetical protein [Acutalibacteraceae bacterium]